MALLHLVCVLSAMVYFGSCLDDATPNQDKILVSLKDSIRPAENDSRQKLITFGHDCDKIKPFLKDHIPKGINKDHRMKTDPENRMPFAPVFAEEYKKLCGHSSHNTDHPNFTPGVSVDKATEGNQQKISRFPNLKKIKQNMLASSRQLNLWPRLCGERFGFSQSECELKDILRRKFIARLNGPIIHRSVKTENSSPFSFEEEYVKSGGKSPVTQRKNIVPNEKAIRTNYALFNKQNEFSPGRYGARGMGFRIRKKRASRFSPWGGKRSGQPLKQKEDISQVRRASRNRFNVVPPFGTNLQQPIWLPKQFTNISFMKTLLKKLMKRKFSAWGGKRSAPSSSIGLALSRIHGEENVVKHSSEKRLGDRFGNDELIDGNEFRHQDDLGQGGDVDKLGNELQMFRSPGLLVRLVTPLPTKVNENDFAEVEDTEGRNMEYSNRAMSREPKFSGHTKRRLETPPRLVTNNPWLDDVSRRQGGFTGQELIPTFIGRNADWVIEE